MAVILGRRAFLAQAAIPIKLLWRGHARNADLQPTQFSRAINLSALLGWAAVAVQMFTTFNPLLWLVSALIGLPIAFAIC